MTGTRSVAGFALVVGIFQGACHQQVPEDDRARPARSDTTAGDTVVLRRDTVPTRTDTAALRPDSSHPRRDSLPSDTAGGAGVNQTVSRLSSLEYEGWRQYSVNCARCHGQDVLPNPVAANLLTSLAPGGPIDTEQKFVQVVTEGRPDRGMPAFKTVVTPDQTKAIYAYVKGRAEKRIPPGRPEEPS
jgi:hypothetical protein